MPITACAPTTWAATASCFYFRTAGPCSRSRRQEARFPLTTAPAEPLNPKQVVSSLTEEPDTDVSGLIDVLANRVANIASTGTPARRHRMRRLHAGRGRPASSRNGDLQVPGGVSKFKDKLVNGMVARGYDKEFAEKTFSQLEGFGSYGFPESHAASFALIAYASSWMKCWHPMCFARPC